MKDSSLSDPVLEHSMESLESKLDRLSPEQRKEVEDFVDFLLFRSGNLSSPVLRDSLSKGSGPCLSRIL